MRIERMGEKHTNVCSGNCCTNKVMSHLDALNSARVVLNISGEIFETFEKTLKRYPKTLLGNLDKRRIYFCPLSQEYFFNRSRSCFGAILYFYQSYGILSCPSDISIEDFEAECHFFELPNKSIIKMKVKEGLIFDVKDDDWNPDDNQFQAKVWNFVENPESSNAATVFAIFSLIMITLSIMLTCLETLPYLDVKSDKMRDNPWYVLEFTFNLWFLLELLARFSFSPSKLKFSQSFLNLVDVFAIVPYFIVLGIAKNKVTSLGFLRILRLMRVMRLFRLSKHSKRLKVIGEIIKSSVGDLQLLMLCLMMLVIFGGSIMYYIEGAGFGNKESQVESIPESLWWAVQTVTTVGYGDVVPITPAGKLLAGCFMTFGALTISLPVLSIVTKFMSIYSRNFQ